MRNVAFAICNINSQCDISASYTGKMDRVSAIRAIIKNDFDGKQARFARAIGRSPALVWQWLNGHRSVGEKVARDIEKKLRLHKGALDDWGFTNGNADAERELSAEQKADAQRLRNLWDTKFSGKISQEEVAHLCGWKTQGAFSQYLNGRTPIGLHALLKISRALGIEPSEVSPRLAAEIPGEGKGGAEYGQHKPRSARIGLVTDAWPEYEALASKASPRSYKQLMRIAEAAADGELSDADINLLNQIAERIAAKE